MLLPKRGGPIPVTSDNRKPRRFDTPLTPAALAATLATSFAVVRLHFVAHGNVALRVELGSVR
jgi:hypothetical protein